jgi:hypothetical protein
MGGPHTLNHRQDTDGHIPRDWFSAAGMQQDNIVVQRRGEDGRQNDLEIVGSIT